MKTLFKTLCMAASLAFVVSACQKEEQNATPLQSHVSSFSKIEDLEQSFPVKKGSLISRPDSVFIWNSVTGKMEKHRTKKFRTLDWSFMQEWLMEDLKTDIFLDNMFYPNDVNGLVHGYYYPWNQFTNIQDGIDGGWELMVSEDIEGEIPAIGFHIPRGERTIGDGTDDILRFASKLGATSLVRSTLDLQYDNFINGEGQYFYSTDTSPSTATCAYIWIDRRNSYNSSNIVPGCGVSAMWYKNQNDQYANGFGNDPRGRMNVRLVRNLTRSQW
jgi:hypothetical protein